ncbi:MAG: HNH endonuclease family protein, partial [Aggregatibacter sp.]|uniref:HNH endonuclease family protein n=1 Tax=Aggregatibacter sp. TaxID=1872413 RepID=UPI00360D596F
IFIYTLLVCRYLFDLYVIKSNMIRTDYENWSLWKIVKRKSSYYYKNVFGDDGLDKNDDEALNDADPTKKALMLLSMFHVSNPSRIYKNWLYAVLRWLFKNKDNITPDNYVDFLEDLCDKFYFGNNCQEKDITDIILGKEKIDFSSNNKKWNDGVLVPNFVFNRLDYQLWKLFQEQEQEQKVEILSENDKWLTIKNKEAIWKKFRFTFRSSVEHHYPQHPSVGDELESGLNDFGNLYLLSQSKNSSLGNSSPEEKKKHYRNNEYDSLKQAIMMNYNEWSEREIEEHGKEMLEILNQSLSKANS